MEPSSLSLACLGRRSDPTIPDAANLEVDGRLGNPQRIQMNFACVGRDDVINFLDEAHAQSMPTLVRRNTRRGESTRWPFHAFVNMCLAARHKYLSGSRRGSLILKNSSTFL